VADAYLFVHAGSNGDWLRINPLRALGMGASIRHTRAGPNGHTPVISGWHTGQVAPRSSAER
jgi:hypothetical protein